MKTIKILFMAFALAFPISASAQSMPVLDKMLTITREAGLELPESKTVVVPGGRIETVVPIVSDEGEKMLSSQVSTRVSGSGMVSGTAFLRCSSTNGSGTMYGDGTLYGNISVHGNDGIHGNVHVSGHVTLYGSCRNGSGSVSGTVYLSGYGTVYDSSGRALGTAHVTGNAFVSGFGYSSAFLSAFATVSGY